MTARRVARALAALLLVGGTVALTAAPADAGGTWLAPVRDRYEVGDSATLVAYVGRGTLGWLDEGPYYGYLHAAGKAPGEPSPTGEPLGRLEVEETGATGWTALRVSVEVPLTGLEPGRYEVGYCNDPCRNGLGDLIGSRTINVGVDAVEPVVREWPLDEPLIQILRPDAMVSGPGYRASASDIWAGRVVPAPVLQLPAPVPESPPTPNTVAVPPPPITPPVAAPSPPVTVTSIVFVTVAPPVTQPSGGSSSPLALVLGVLVAAVCTGGVLRALRRDVAPVTGRYATWRNDGSSSTSSPTTHAPASSAPSS